MNIAKMLGAKEIAARLDISVSHAYKIIRRLNNELEASGHMVISGRVSSRYFEEKFFGLPAVFDDGGDTYGSL